MTLFVQPEGANFLRATRRKPWLWPVYGADLVRLVARRLTNTLRLRASRRAPHRGLKVWPVWLGPQAISVAVPAELVFPAYHPEIAPARAADLPGLAFPDGDPERDLARHRWGECLAAALSSETDAQAAFDRACTWLRDPPLRGDAAWETYSSAERVVNLAVLLAVHPRVWKTAEADARAQIARFFADSAQWIHDHLEFYGFARTNNHILNDARALIVAGRVLGDGVVLARGVQIFATMAARLFGPQGMLRERSSHYQLVVANWAMDALHFADGEIDPAAADARATLAAQCATIATATARCVAAWRGLDTHIGDISPDCHPTLSARRFASLYPAAARTDAGPCDAWALVEVGEDRLLACGMAELAPLSYANHGHADIGGLIWAHGDDAVLVDAGRSSYAPGEPGSGQRAAAAHNVATVDGLAPLAGSLLVAGEWSPRPYATATVSLEPRETGLSWHHDGFARIPGVGAYRRDVDVTAAGVSVADHLDGAASVAIETAWHFAPGFVPDGDHACVDAAKRLRVVVDLGAETGVTAEWQTYTFASAYGVARQAWVLRLRRRVSLPWSATTNLGIDRCAE